MKLRDALLCSDCEAIYSFGSRCPRCGGTDATRLDASFDTGGAVQIADPIGLLRVRTAAKRSWGRHLVTLGAILAALAASPARAAVTGGGKPSRESPALTSCQGRLPIFQPTPTSAPAARMERHTSCSSTSVPAWAQRVVGGSDRFVRTHQARRSRRAFPERRSR